jgi:hypothetical protein
MYVTCDRKVRWLHAVEEGAGIKLRIVQVDAQANSICARVYRGRGAILHPANIEVGKAIVLHEVFAIVGTRDEQLLHPFPFIEFVDGGASKRVHFVAEVFHVELRFEIRTPRHFETDYVAEKIVGSERGLLLVIVREFETNGSDALFDRGGPRVEGASLSIEGSAQIVLLRITVEASRAHDRAGRVAHRDIEETSLE